MHHTIKVEYRDREGDHELVARVFERDVILALLAAESEALRRSPRARIMEVYKIPNGEVSGVTYRQRFVVRAILSYALSNVDEINEALYESDNNSNDPEDWTIRLHEWYDDLTDGGDKDGPFITEAEVKEIMRGIKL